MLIVHRKILLSFLVLFFIIQSLLVYLDSNKFQKISFSPSAQLGRTIWLENNCQSCHQIYGFGGFLGPDLTNTAKYYSSEDLIEILETGPLQMPSIKLSKKEAKDLSAFFNEIDKTGVSVPIINNYQTTNHESIEIKDIPWFEY